MSRAPIVALLGALTASACGNDVGVVVPSDGTTSDGTSDVPGTSGASGGDELGASEEVSGHADTTSAPDTADPDTTGSVDPTADGTTSSATTGEEDTDTGDPPSWCDDADCDDADPCTDDACDEDARACVHTLAPGNPCDDGNACTASDTCQPDGTCTGDGTCTVEHCGTIASDETWGPEVVHVLTCAVFVEGLANPTLTILDGTTVLAEPDSALIIGGGDPGRMEVQGTNLGVLLSAADPLPGAGWAGVHLGGHHTDSEITGATIEHVGAFGEPAIATASGYGARLVMTNSVVRHNAADGILAIHEAILELHDSTVVDNGGIGILVTEDSTLEMHGTSVITNGGDGIAFDWGGHIAELPAPFTDNEITLNAGAPMRVGADDLRHLDTSSSFAGNGEPIVVAGTASSPGTWRALDEIFAVGPGVGIQIASYSGTPAVIEIEPGVTVLMDADAFFWIQGGEAGVVLAHGTADAPIRFIGGALQFYGFGGVLEVTASELVHVIVEDGRGIEVYGTDVHILDSIVRGNSGFAGIDGNNGSELVITGTLVEDNAGPGIQLFRAPSAPLTDNVITGNDSAMSVGAEVPELIAQSTVIAGNGEDAVRVGGTIHSGDTTWPLLDVPYLVGSVAVSGSNVLTIAPGVTLEFVDDAVLEVGWIYEAAEPDLVVPGALVAIGTADAPITFRSASSTPGGWAGIVVQPHALFATLEHCVVQHAGGNGFDGAIVVRTDAVSISSCTITDSASWGIYQDGATATLTANTFAGNALGDVFP